jgi:hypothetical protein
MFVTEVLKKYSASLPGRKDENKIPYISSLIA